MHLMTCMTTNRLQKYDGRTLNQKMKLPELVGFIKELFTLFIVQNVLVYLAHVLLYGCFVRITKRTAVFLSGRPMHPDNEYVLLSRVQITWYNCIFSTQPLFPISSKLKLIINEVCVVGSGSSNRTQLKHFFIQSTKLKFFQHFV